MLFRYRVFVSAKTSFGGNMRSRRMVFPCVSRQRMARLRYIRSLRNQVRSTFRAVLKNKSPLSVSAYLDAFFAIREMLYAIAKGRITSDELGRTRHCIESVLSRIDPRICEGVDSGEVFWAELSVRSAEEFAALLAEWRVYWNFAASSPRGRGAALYAGRIIQSTADVI